MNTYTTDQPIAALRKVYQKSLLTNLGAIAASILAFLLFFGFGSSGNTPLSLALSVGLAAASSITEFFIERALHKSGRSSGLVYLLFFLLPLLALEAMSRSGLFPESGVSGILFAVCFIFFRPLISVVILISDSRCLREESPLEAVGRMKRDSHRDGDAPGHDTSLLFEDELTHTVLMLHTKEMSPAHRYRVWYLPRTGLAVSQPIPEDAELDPFGNVIQTEDPFAQASATDTPTPAEPNHQESGSCDPNSPERQTAARLAVWSQVCKFLSFGMMGLSFLGAVIAKGNQTVPYFVFFLLLPAVGIMLLGSFCKSRELKLRCTVRTTAHCVDTVHRRSGKHSHYYPIVEFEVNGVPHTAELSSSCSSNAVGDLYSIYYDPLDPKTVRLDKRIFFD